MAIEAVSFLAMLAVSTLLDAAVRPRGRRRWQGLALQALATTAAFGLVLALSGNAAVAALLVVAFAALLMIASNAKHAMLGEPLLFSDLALFGWVFRHPRFYLTALTAGQRWLLALCGPVLLVALAITFVPRWAPHGLGLGVGCVATLLLALVSATPPFRDLARVPDADADVARLGLIATLLLYWQRWRGTPDPVPGGAATAEPTTDQPDLIVIVQCESFADPVALTGDPELALPGLESARASAWQHGALGVSGFGAYTMRTEYGVLFGRDEAALGFRRYDPFLTALGETGYALPRRLAGHRALFVHPHDMGFYGRDRLMPAIGFAALVGQESFPPIAPDGHRYVDDATLGAKIGTLIDAASEPTLVYAVTMENHGPWIRDARTGSHGGLPAYLRHLRNSDAMLSSLIDRLAASGRSALLVFFGDHRPSIPGVTAPGAERHTPYVMLRFDRDGAPIRGPGQAIDLVPAELHHAILAAVCAAPSRTPSGPTH